MPSPTKMRNGRARRGGAKRALRLAVQKIAKDLVQMQRDCADLGLFATMHVLNDASKKLGWEAAEKLG